MSESNYKLFHTDVNTLRSAYISHSTYTDDNGWSQPTGLKIDSLIRRGELHDFGEIKEVYIVGNTEAMAEDYNNGLIAVIHAPVFVIATHTDTYAWSVEMDWANKDCNGVPELAEVFMKL